ncbi:DNA polymerase III subunit gamma/tau [Agromyces sp. NPDC049794]|uniref:DNA polymerase III subunit gamma/tau n=1 Tax=unclassified Agromyces TaxID=2639701 RepID=UPI0033FC4332
MARDSDDEALRWEGDDDPTLAPGWKTVGQPVPLAGAPAGERAEGAAADEAGGKTAATDAPRQAGSAELVILGVLGGVYLLYAIGWLITATTPAPALADPVAQFMYGLGRWLAVAAPALWFGTVLWLAAEHRRARLIWLIAGAVLLVPVPFLLRG